MVATQQHALTVVAPLRADLGPLDDVARAMKRRGDDVIEALKKVPSMHFGRFVLLPDQPGGTPTKLAFESNHDGPLEAHLDELAAALPPALQRELFGVCEGWEELGLRAFVAKHARPAKTYYLGHPGLSVARIHADDEVRRRLCELLDARDRAGTLEGKSATAIKRELVAELEADGVPRYVGTVDRGLPVQPFAERRLWLVGALVGVLGIFGFAPAALVVEHLERKRQKDPEHAPRLVSEGDPRLDAIIEHEDRVTQNGLTHYVDLRPGRFRRTTLLLVLWFLEHARKKLAYMGTLGGISSIHFARWVLLEDGKVLFFSNYDGSWEAYLGDFVDKAHYYLTAVWSNTRWFPDTRLLILGGAAKESTFKQWTRTFQVENQIWYSAYPHLTVGNVLRNARLREGAAFEMNEDEARDWLALL